MTRPRRGKRATHSCPICAQPNTDRTLPYTIPCAIPTYWSPETALAVFELIDEMRDIVSAVYRTEIEDAARSRCNSSPADLPVIPDDELPF
jgi:hypothetical protein